MRCDGVRSGESMPMSLVRRTGNLSVILSVVLDQIFITTSPMISNLCQNFQVSGRFQTFLGFTETQKLRNMETYIMKN